jgi:hypothetical protein
VTPSVFGSDRYHTEGSHSVVAAHIWLQAAICTLEKLLVQGDVPLLPEMRYPIEKEQLERCCF